MNQSSLKIMELLYNQSIKCASFVKLEYLEKNLTENIELMKCLNYLEKKVMYRLIMSIMAI